MWRLDDQLAGKEWKFFGGHDVLEAIRATVSSNTQVTFSADGSGGEGRRLAVVVIGESPYAEGQGRPFGFVARRRRY